MRGSKEASFIFIYISGVFFFFLTIYQASPRVEVDETFVTQLGDKLQKEDPTPEIFDEIQRNVCFI